MRTESCWPSFVLLGGFFAVTSSAALTSTSNQSQQLAMALTDLVTTTPTLTTTPDMPVEMARFLSLNCLAASPSVFLTGYLPLESQPVLPRAKPTQPNNKPKSRQKTTTTPRHRRQRQLRRRKDTCGGVARFVAATAGSKSDSKPSPSSRILRWSAAGLWPVTARKSRVKWAWSA